MLKHIYLRIMSTKKTLRSKRPSECGGMWNDEKGVKREIGPGVVTSLGHTRQQVGGNQLDGHLTYRSVDRSADRFADRFSPRLNGHVVDGGGEEPSCEGSAERASVPSMGRNPGHATDPHDELMRVLAYASSQVIKSLHLRQHYINSKDYFMSLSLICNQLAAHRFKDHSFWNTLGGKLTALLRIEDVHKTMSVRWLALILNSFARVYVLNEPLLKEASIYVRNCKEENLHTFDISQIANCFAKLNYGDAKLFTHMEQQICERIDELSCQSISNLCNAYSKLSLGSATLFCRLIKAVEKNLNNFKEQEIANILNAYSKLGEKKHYHLFVNFLPHICAKFDHFKPVEMVMIANAYSKCKLFDRTFFSLLCKYTSRNADLFEPSEWAILANVYANFNLRDVELFYLIRKKVSDKEHLLQHRNVAMLLHAFGKLQIRDEAFVINLVKKKKHIIDSLDSRNLTLFYVSLIKLNLRIPMDILANLKRNISNKLHTFTDLALVSICYSSMFLSYFDLKLVSSILLLLNERRANSKSFAHQMHVTLFVLHSVYDFGQFSPKFLLCLHQLLSRAYQHIAQPNYYDINMSAIQKRISPFFPKNCLNVQTEVPVGPFVVDFLLTRKRPAARAACL
ncbi:hypothetical protein C922_03900 [Plasmodium inui San Antonio 1]|uniref:RNA-editing substrate-binding complex 6 protein domain-containing protein n=1 Tax=Plasmodium inui San Antonio 1 TaxID=1237626 RepID=W6ZXY4_9APIC|nr:hypothetical protein C922_03900 [Plasmodium inui San Antonio 1]EUD65652.1 hypothetical protein C922_03900 [Plasmodium inui San Antonio 1]